MNFKYRRNPTAETVVFGLVFLAALIVGTIYLTRETDQPEAPSAATAGRWELQDSGVTNTLLDVKFVNDTHGWAVGEGGVIIATTDGGKTWTIQYSGYELTLNSVDFTDEANGWVVGQLGLILNTNDGGNTWAVQGKDAALGQNLIKVHFDNAGEGRIITERGSFALSTTDGGRTWIANSSRTHCPAPTPSSSMSGAVGFLSDPVQYSRQPTAATPGNCWRGSTAWR